MIRRGLFALFALTPALLAQGNPDWHRAFPAFKIAGNPEAYPEQIADGLAPWQPKRRMRRSLQRSRCMRVARGDAAHLQSQAPHSSALPHSQQTHNLGARVW